MESLSDLPKPLRLSEREFISRCKSTLSAMKQKTEEDLDILYSEELLNREAILKLQSKLETLKLILCWYKDRP